MPASHGINSHALLPNYQITDFVDLLKRSAPSRIVSTSSFLAFTNNLSPEKLYETNFDSIIQRNFVYGNSKLGLIMMSDILTKKLKGTGVTANCVHPGLVTTPIFTDVYSISKNSILEFSFQLIHKLFAKVSVLWILTRFKDFFQDPWEGSQCLVYAAVEKTLEKVSGKFFSDCGLFVKPWKAYDKELCQKIWNETEKIVDLGPNERL